MRFSITDSTLMMKALADNSRLLIINYLFEKAGYVEELSERLDLSASTVSFHLKKLEEAGLVIKTKKQYYSEFSVNEQVFNSTLKEIVGFENNEKKIQEERVELYRIKIIDSFFDDGRLIRIPSQQKKRMVILEWFASKFEYGKFYSEEEISEIIKKYYDDYCTIRRELVDYGYMDRENAVYNLQKHFSPQGFVADKKNKVRNNMIDKKQIKQDYKQLKEPYGLYIVSCTENNKFFIGQTMNPSGKLKRVKMELDYGTHPYKNLQEDYNKYGEDKIKIEVLVQFEIKDETQSELKIKLKNLLKEWKDKLQKEGKEHY